MAGLLLFISLEECINKKNQKQVCSFSHPFTYHNVEGANNNWELSPVSSESVTGDISQQRSTGVKARPRVELSLLDSLTYASQRTPTSFLRVSYFPKQQIPTPSRDRPQLRDHVVGQEEPLADL